MKRRTIALVTALTLSRTVAFAVIAGRRIETVQPVRRTALAYDPSPGHIIAAAAVVALAIALASSM